MGRPVPICEYCRRTFTGRLRAWKRIPLPGGAVLLYCRTCWEVQIEEEVDAFVRSY